MKRERENLNDTREELASYIADNPGVTFSLLKSIFQINPGTLRYHLEYLEGEDRIKMIKRGNRKCYYMDPVSGLDPDHGHPDLNLHQRRMIRVIKENPGISRKELICLTKQSREEVNYNLRRLKEKKVIWKVMDGGDPCYEYITKEQLAAEMMVIILEKFLDDEMDRATFVMLKRKIEEDLDT